MSLAEKIADLEAKARNATPGEWFPCFTKIKGKPYLRVISTLGITNLKPKHAARRLKSGYVVCSRRCTDTEEYFKQWELDADYIAAASPETVLELCAALREAGFASL